MNRWLWTDSQRAGAGAAVGASVAVGVVGTMFGPLSAEKARRGQ